MKLAGVFPTVLTPWTSEDRLDLRALEAQLSYYLEAGVHGLVILGSIGEAPLVDDAEREAMIAETVRGAQGRPVIAGITAHGTRVAARQVERATALGAAASLVAMPRYYDLSFEAVREHFRACATAGPTLYYNYPPATRLSLSVEHIGELLGLPGVVGIKESIFDLAAIEAHAKAAPHASVLSGSELDLVEVMARGGAGAISAGAVTMPRTAVRLYDAILGRDEPLKKTLQNQLFEALPTMVDLPGSVAAARLGFQSALKKGAVPEGSVDTRVARMKAALATRGVPIEARVRAPLAALSERDRAAVDAAMLKIKEIE